MGPKHGECYMNRLGAHIIWPWKTKVQETDRKSNPESKCDHLPAVVCCTMLLVWQVIQRDMSVWGVADLVVQPTARGPCQWCSNFLSAMFLSCQSNTSLVVCRLHIHWFNTGSLLIFQQFRYGAHNSKFPFNVTIEVIIEYNVVLSSSTSRHHNASTMWSGWTCSNFHCAVQ
jgi:hypothetical protein